MADPKRSPAITAGGCGKRPSPGRLGARRQRNVLSILQKVELLEKLDRGASVAQLREAYGVGLSTVYDLRGQKDKIMKFYAESDSIKGMAKRKTLRGPRSSDLDKVLYEWFRQRRRQGVPVSGPMLMEKARKYHSELKIDGDCDYSTGWLQKFKNRHGIRHLRAGGEKLPPGHGAAGKSAEDFVRLKENDLTAEIIYKGDEKGLFWHCFPRNALVCNDKKSASGVKESKETLTLLTCDNEIIDVTLDPKSVESDSSDQQEVSQEKMTITEGIATFTRLINFLEQKSFITQQEIMQMYRIRDKLIKQRPNRMKQTTLITLFQKAYNHCIRQSTVIPTPLPIPLLGGMKPELNISVSDESPAPSVPATAESVVSSPVASTSSTPDNA